MIPKKQSRRLSNLFIPQYTSDIKFCELNDLAPDWINPQLEEEKYNENVLVPFGIWDAVKGTHLYKELLSKLKIETYENADALEMVKKNLDSECTNYAITNEILEEILNRDDSREEVQDPDWQKEADTLFLWRTSKLGIRSIAIKCWASTYFVRKVVRKYKDNVKKMLCANRVKSNKQRRVISEEQISKIEAFWRRKDNTLFYISDVINEVW